MCRDIYSHRSVNELIFNMSKEYNACIPRLVCDYFWNNALTISKILRTCAKEKLINKQNQNSLVVVRYCRPLPIA